MKLNIGVIYGGLSVEHDVSIITGIQAVENLDKSKYSITPLYIDKHGDWFFGDKLLNLKIYKDWNKNRKKIKSFIPTLNKNDKKNILNNMDMILIACHGTYGEDGKLQSVLEFLDIPYSSTGVVGSASGMDKIIMKKVFLGMSLPVLPYLWILKKEWEKDQNECVNKVHYTLDYPVFIKPANLGSSIGISMANNEKELINAVEIALKYDNRIIIEKGIKDPVEINCSAMISGDSILISELEEPVHWEEFLSFEDKYIRSNTKSKSGMSDMQRKIPADVTDDIKNEIEKITKDIYQTMDCKGVVRIDFLLDEDRTKVYVNEINTIPGSFSFYLWEPKGVNFSNLLDVLVEEAIKENKTKKDRIITFDSPILERISGGAKV